MVQAGQLEPHLSTNMDDPLTYVGSLRGRPLNHPL